jgi:hypothetical protein
MSKLQTISFEEYLYKSETHKARIHAMLGSYFDERGRGKSHAILDFLVEYYSFRRSHLLTWSPGLLHHIETDQANQQPEGNFWLASGTYYVIPSDNLSSKKKQNLHWNLRLLEAIDQREARFQCQGMHEWAMVYATTEKRHSSLNLRLSNDEIDAFVRSQSLGCSHIDAFRFFTEEARPLNKFQPIRETQIEFDQPGCIHVNMDLYKWAYKAWPYISSDLIADTLELALEARILDMQASPYDLSAYHLEPVRIETEEGRQEYEYRQRTLSEQAKPLRKRLINAYYHIFEYDFVVS